jgi:hypothetical protein
VAEHPDLWAQYGADAVAFAGAALETLDAYANDLSGPRGHPTLSYYKPPRTYRTLLTEPRCQAAYDAARRGEGPDGWAINEDPPALGLLKQWKRNCNTGHQVANCESRRPRGRVHRAWHLGREPIPGGGRGRRPRKYGQVPPAKRAETVIAAGARTMPLPTRR